MKLPTHLGHQSDFQIRTYEIDQHKNATAVSLSKLMHEAAMENVLDLKLSVWDLEPQAITWVLMRKKYDIIRFPKLGEKISIITYPAGFEKFFTYRDFLVCDENETPIAQASTTWLLMNTKNRKMVRIPDFIMEYAVDTPPVEKCLERALGKIPKFEQAERGKYFSVGWHDLDFNGHLSNSAFMQWMIETLPIEMLQNKSIKTMHLIYKAEAVFGNQLKSEMQQLEETSFLHRIIRVRDGKELCVGWTIFGDNI